MQKLEKKNKDIKKKNEEERAKFEEAEKLKSYDFYKP